MLELATTNRVQIQGILSLAMLSLLDGLQLRPKVFDRQVRILLRTLDRFVELVLAFNFAFSKDFVVPNRLEHAIDHGGVSFVCVVELHFTLDNVAVHVSYILFPVFYPEILQLFTLPEYFCDFSFLLVHD